MVHLKGGYHNCATYCAREFPGCLGEGAGGRAKGDKLVSGLFPPYLPNLGQPAMHAVHQPSQHRVGHLADGIQQLLLVVLKGFATQ
jgi:hypothetical protein